MLSPGGVVAHAPAGVWGQFPAAREAAGLWLQFAVGEGVQPRCSFLLPRLRSVKMEQRKLSDQANTLVDLSKASPCGDLPARPGCPSVSLHLEKLKRTWLTAKCSCSVDVSWESCRGTAAPARHEEKQTRARGWWAVTLLPERAFAPCTLLAAPAGRTVAQQHRAGHPSPLCLCRGEVSSF